LALAKPDIDVAVYLLQAPPQLVNPIYRILDPTGQLAHLRFEPIHAKLAINRGAGTRRGNRAPCAAVHLPLQHAQIPLQPIETVLHRSILRSRHLSRQGDGQNHQQQC